MSNLQQNEIEQIKKGINVLQDRLKKNKKSLNQFQNGFMGIKRMSKKKTKIGFFSNQKKKIQNIVKNIVQNKIEQIKKDKIFYYKIYLHK